MIFWSIGTLLTNTYTFYLKKGEEREKPPKENNEQYAFRNLIAKYLIYPNDTKAAKTGKESSTTGSRTQSIFEMSSPTSTISTGINPLVSLDGMKRTRRIPDASLEPNGIQIRSIYLPTSCNASQKQKVRNAKLGSRY